MSEEIESSKGGGLRVIDGAIVVVVGVVAAVVGFEVLRFLAGVFFEIVKVAVVVGIIGGIFWVLKRRR